MSWKAGRMSTSKVHVYTENRLTCALHSTKLYSIDTVRKQSWVYEKDSKMIK